MARRATLRSTCRVAAAIALLLVVPARASAAPAARFLAQFASEEGWRRRHAPGFCSGAGKDDRPCRTISRRLLPPGSSSVEVQWPPSFPLDAAAFRRGDASDDAEFYARPRFVQHFGDAPRASLQAFYADVIATLGKVNKHVDICSSWVSHLPEDYDPRTLVGLGMNREELEKNARLTDFIVQNLNENTKLPFADRTVDIFTNAMSVDYLIKPLEVFEEMKRALRPGGVAVMSFSNHFFPTKVIGVWKEVGDIGRCAIAASYFHYTGFERVAAYEVHTGTRNDPLYVVLGYAPEGGRHPPTDEL